MEVAGEEADVALEAAARRVDDTYVARANLHLARRVVSDRPDQDAVAREQLGGCDARRGVPHDAASAATFAVAAAPEEGGNEGEEESGGQARRLLRSLNHT